jgi:hypothetical protein
MSVPSGNGKMAWEGIIDAKIRRGKNSYKIASTVVELDSFKDTLRELISSARTRGETPTVEELQAFYNDYYQLIKTGELKYILIDSLYTYIPGEELTIINVLRSINPSFVQPESQGSEFDSQGYNSAPSQGGGKRKTRNARKSRKTRNARKTRNVRKTRNGRKGRKN